MVAISKVLRARDQVLDELEELLSPFWGSLADELGLRRLGTSIPHAKEITLLGEMVRLVYVGVPKTENRKGARRKLVVAIPSEVLDGGIPAIQNYVRQTYPIKCLKCGLALPIGTQPWDTTYCSHDTFWRPESPRPQFYIGQEQFGYQVPSRGRRYVYDLDGGRLVALQIQNRFTYTWYSPPCDLVKRHLRNFETGVLPALPSAFGGNPLHNVNVRNFAFELPEWCIGSVWL